MFGDDSKKDGDKTTPTSSPEVVAFKSSANEKTSRKSLIEARIVALFQKGLSETSYKEYDALLQDKASLSKADPVGWVQAMSKVLDIEAPDYAPSMFPEEKIYLAELLAKYIDNARDTSYQMRIASGVSPKHSTTTPTLVGPTEQNTSDAIPDRFKKLDSSFEALGFHGADTATQNPSNKKSGLPLTPQRSAQEATPSIAAPKPANAEAAILPDEKQEETRKPGLK